MCGWMKKKGIDFKWFLEDDEEIVILKHLYLGNLWQCLGGFFFFFEILYNIF